MIGSVSIPVPVSSIGSNPGNIVTSQFFGFDGITGYQIADTIQPGKGYWVRVNQTASLILPSNLSSGKTTPSNTIRIVPTTERPPAVPGPDLSSQRSKIPKQYDLQQNYPNPFNPTTIITYDLPVESRVQLKIYNLLGQAIATLVDEVKKPGEYSIRWDARNLSSGIYYYELITPVYTSTRKLLVLK